MDALHRPGVWIKLIIEFCVSHRLLNFTEVKLTMYSVLLALIDRSIQLRVIPIPKA